MQFHYVLRTGSQSEGMNEDSVPHYLNAGSMFFCARARRSDEVCLTSSK